MVTRRIEIAMKNTFLIRIPQSPIEHTIEKAICWHNNNGYSNLREEKAFYPEEDGKNICNPESDEVLGVIIRMIASRLLL